MSEIRDEELALLHEAAGLLGRTLDPAVIYDTLRAMMARAMDCASLLVSIHTPEDDLIRCVYAWVEGRDVDVAPFPPIPLAQEGRGHAEPRHPLRGTADHPGCRRRREDAVLPLLCPRDGTVTAEPHPDKPRIQSLIVVPIALEGRILGAVQVMSHHLDAYTPPTCICWMRC